MTNRYFQTYSILITAFTIKNHYMNMSKQQDLVAFKSVLKKYGFIKINTSNWGRPNMLAYEHKKNGWYAEIEDYRNWYEVWAVGGQLKETIHYPGGHNYSDPLKLEEELSRHE